MVADLEKRTMKKVTMRIVPFLMVCYVFAYIDRVNIGFAALQMNQDLALTSAAFGLASGLFFVAYFLFEVPSNILMEKVGARYWMARIMISWGLISAVTAFVQGASSLYVMRFLLGVAEAGFFPGVILYLTYFFPAAYRARIVALFSVALPASLFLGSPISAALLGLDGFFGLRGWQWMFLLEGVPSVLLGIACLWMLADSPEKARWLSADEKAWLLNTLEAEKQEKKPVEQMTVIQVLSNRHVLTLSFVYVGAISTSVCLAIWQPQILKSFGLSNMITGWVNAIPFGVATIAMVWWARSSDRTGERAWHTAIPLTAMALALIGTTMTQSLFVTVLLLCFILSGVYAVKGPFWALATQYLSASTTAVAVAHINAIGNLSGFVATWLFGLIRDHTSDAAFGLLILVPVNAIATIVVLRMKRHVRLGHASRKAASG
jgi:ACS family tartrate transporter-like MFS transporter